MIDWLVVLLVFAGAVAQTGVGIGFSILAGPGLMLTLGVTIAVPLLLLLNTIVSLVGTVCGYRSERKRIANYDLPPADRLIVGIAAGIGLGAITYPYVSSKLILLATGLVLLFSAFVSLLATGLIKVDSPHLNRSALLVVSVIAGFATSWTATPGPILALGLIILGLSSRQVRWFIQPLALIAYAAALLLHLYFDGAIFLAASNFLLYVVVALAGSIVGIVVVGRLPESFLTVSIKTFSVIAGGLLVYRAISVSGT